MDESFDVVACRSALHHFGDPAGAVAEMARVCRRQERVAVSDAVVPDPSVRDAYDGVHRLLDPPHARAFTADEIADLLQAQVGPVGRREQNGPGALPLDAIMTDVADRQAVRRALDAELDGGLETGFLPARAEGALMVSFTTVVMHATRP